MKAIEFNKEIKFHTNYPKPTPQKGEALIKVSLAGICNTDIEIMKGYMGFSGILGHEFVGSVEEVNSDKKELLNKRVAGEINCPCNNCDYCLKGLKNHCPNRNVLGILNKNGCFAEYITLPIENLIEIPGNVSDEEAIFVEPLAAAFQILEQVHLKPSDKVLILGDGKLGLLIALALNLSQANVMLIGKHNEKLDLVKNQGIQAILLDQLNINKEYNIVVDATGTIEGFELAQNLVKPRSTIVLKSTVAGSKNINLAPLVIDEINLIGSRCGEFKPAVRALENKLFDVKPLISGKFKFDNSEEAIKLSQTKGALKVIIDFN